MVFLTDIFKKELVTDVIRVINQEISSLPSSAQESVSDCLSWFAYTTGGLEKCNILSSRV